MDALSRREVGRCQGRSRPGKNARDASRVLFCLPPTAILNDPRPPIIAARAPAAARRACRGAAQGLDGIGWRMMRSSMRWPTRATSTRRVGARVGASSQRTTSSG